jgi:hypothetical protein
MAEHSVVGIYGTLREAEAAVRSLGDRGFPLQKVSIIAKHLEDEQRVHEYIAPADIANRSATVGIWAGGIFGVLAGVAFVWVPGFGPLVIAGSVAAELIGGVEGAMAGASVAGALGWLVGLGIAKEKIHKYEAAVKSGKYLVIANGPVDTAKRALEILAGTKAEHLEMHAPATS